MPWGIPAAYPKDPRGTRRPNIARAFPARRRSFQRGVALSRRGSGFHVRVLRFQRRRKNSTGGAALRVGESVRSGDRPMQRTLRLRITVVDPVPGVTLRVQSGRAELLAPSRTSETEISFDFAVRVDRRPTGE